MKKVLVTGASGFIGRNLCLALQRTGTYEVLPFDLPQDASELASMAGRADVIFHLAGVNRPKEEKEFVEGNAELTRQLCDCIERAGHRPVLVLSSSIQAELDNPYGRSKRMAEQIVEQFHSRTGTPIRIYRFPNVFGKWSRPNYNTVVATFCHNISRGLPVQVSNRANPLRLVYIDDIVREFESVAASASHNTDEIFYEVAPAYTTTLGELHDLIVSFQNSRSSKHVPDLSNGFAKALYSTFLSFLDTTDFARPVDLKVDDRGWLFELVKSQHSGQVFVSRTKPGITRGNHYHDTKVEKFCVVQGQGVVRLRHLLAGGAIDYKVDDRNIQIVDIPPGYTHSIENTGSCDMLTLFWANEIFDSQRPDTHFVKVIG